MTILSDVLAELFAMFVGDIRLSAAILAVVACSAALTELTDTPPLAGGAILLLGCLAVLLENVLREAKRRRS